MIAGHFGLAAAIKGREPAVPLWALSLAVVWLDLAFLPLFVAGIETLEVPPGTSGYGAAIIHADWTHSVVGAALLSLLLGGLGGGAWGRRAGVVLGLAAASHWVLDLVVHRADLPVLPGNWGGLPLLGLGLWRWPLASACAEAALVVLGAALYARAARSLPARRDLGRLNALLILLAGLATLGIDLAGL